MQGSHADKVHNKSIRHRMHKGPELLLLTSPPSHHYGAAESENKFNVIQKQKGRTTRNNK